jgi:hypothetical protein
VAVKLSMSLLWICGGGRRAADVEGSGPMGGEGVMWKSNVIGWGLLAGDVFVERVTKNARVDDVEVTVVGEFLYFRRRLVEVI